MDHISKSIANIQGLTLINGSHLSTNTNNNADLDYEYFAKQLIVLEAAKRDDIPKLTIKIWYNELINKGFTKEKFDKAMQTIAMTKQYGQIKIDDFYANEILYTERDLEIEVQKRIKKALAEGKKLFTPEVSADEKDKINLYILDVLQRQSKSNHDDLILSYQNKREEDAKIYYVNLKRLIKGLNFAQKEYLYKNSELYDCKNGIEAQKTIINNLSNFAEHFTEAMINEAVKNTLKVV